MNTLFKPTSYKKGAALAVSATFVWKLISFANALLLALYFGATRQTDVYFYLILLTGLGSSFFQNLYSTVLIPEAQFLLQKAPAKAQAFSTMWLYIFGAVGLFAGAVGLIWPEQIWSVLSHFNGPVLGHDKPLLISGFILFGLQNITYYLTALSEMYKFFKTAWLSVLNALLPLAFLLLWGRQLGIISMLYGFIAANILQIVILLSLFKTQLNWSFTPAWVPLRAQTRQNILTGQTLAVLGIFTGWFPLYLMSNVGAGVVSALTYCRQFTDSTTEILISRTANVAKIQLTEQTAQQQYAQANQTFLATTYALLALLAPLAVFSCYFAPQIVTIFLQRGQFSAHDTAQTVAFLRPMLFVLVLSVPGYLQNSAIFAGRKIKEWFPYSLTSTLIFSGLLGWGIPHWGAFSYPYLIGIALLIGFVLNAWLFKRHFAFLAYGKQLRLVVKFVVLAAVALVPAVWVLQKLPTNPWLQIGICGVVYVVGYGLLLLLNRDLKRLFHLATDNF